MTVQKVRSGSGSTRGNSGSSHGCEKGWREDSVEVFLKDQKYKTKAGGDRYKE